MKIFSSSQEAQKQLKKPVLALGNFDGVHLAHQKMFEMARELASQTGGISTVYTFEPHPAKLLSPQSAPPLIQTLEQKIEQIRLAQMEALILEPFSLDFSRLSPQDFFEKILIERLHTLGIVVGYDFTFGAKRTGTTETLKELCRAHQIHLQVLEPFLLEKTLVSSTQIRHLVQEGRVERAALLLGRPFEILTQVVGGEKRGSHLGFPTANLETPNELLPANGVYATKIQIGFDWHSSVTNIGYRPTFGGKNLTLETHILNFQKQIYGQKVRLNFIKKIREELSFSSPEELIKQIQNDIGVAQKFLES